MALAPGAHLGTYEIIGLLGAGGMGEVYRAADSALGREVAIKVLPETVAGHPDRLARFEREARLLASISHPNIAVVHGLERSPDGCYLVMELVRGETLAQRLVRGPVPLADALDLFGQIADALDAAHSQTIMHRDLKPANVMVTPNGLVKILDFGLAKVSSAEDSSLSASPTFASSATKTGTVLGTAAYMSPEQARGDPVDRRTDIWAYGCLLFECLTGERAFPGRTTSDTIATVLREEPDWSLLSGRAPLIIERLIRRCLQKNPRQRLHDIADARIEIEEAAHKPAASASEITVVSNTRALPQVSTALVAAAVLLLGLAAAGIAWWQRPAQTAAPPVARVTIPLLPGQVVERTRFPPLALSPDGRLLVYAAAAGGGRTSLFMRRLDELTPRPVEATAGASTPFFSPDGRWLAFYADGLLKKVPVAGGVPLTIGEAPPVWSASWGADDTIVFASTQAPEGLWRVSANGGDPVQITTPGAGEAHGYPQILPGGTRVLFSVRRQDEWRLALTSLDGGAWTELGNGRIVGDGAQYVHTGHLIYAQSGGLVATPFDPERGVLDQPPVPLLDRVETSRFRGAYFAFAPEAGTLAYVPAASASVARRLLRVGRDGRAAPLIEAQAAYEHPAVSPDGRQLAVGIASETGGDIWLIDLDRSTRIRFTNGGGTAFPIWNPDGSRLGFQWTGPGPWNLFWQPLDGTRDPQPLIDVDPAAAPATGLGLLPGILPTLSGAGPQFPTSWSPDGFVAFHERKPGGERDIWIAAPGDAPVPFLLTADDEWAPRFSPDGKWLAYVSDEAGRYDVYVQPYPGPGPKWLVSPDGGIDPVWSRDGRELFYRQGDQLMAVTVTPAAAFSAGRPQRLFEMRFDAGDSGPNYDVSRDGTWFVVPRGDGTAPAADLHVVFNWLTEVLARTDSRGARRATAPDRHLASSERRRP